MSDDDCDIFNMPTKRPNALPQNMEVPTFEVKQMDYDFIETHTEPKKPTKGSKIKRNAAEKPKAKPRAKDKKEEEEGEAKEAEQNNNNNEIGPQLVNGKTELLASSKRELSPVSQMIYDMEQIKANAVEDLPIARRTRSSLGGRSAAPEPAHLDTLGEQLSMSPTKRRRVNTRSKAAKEFSDSLNSTESFTAMGHRGTRQQVAEFAARSQVLDSIDLISAVMPRIEGFVNLDSEDEDSTCMHNKEAEKETHNIEAENPETDINLSWLGEIQMYKLRLHQKFSHMFKEISERNGVNIDDIVINLDDRFIAPSESPHVVGLKIYHILNGCAMKSKTHKPQAKVNSNLLLKPKKFQLKVQGDKWKKPLIIAMKKSETFKILYIKCAEEMECDLQDFKLIFDGDLLEMDDTPKNQDMEGNEMIDFRLK